MLRPLSAGLSRRRTLSALAVVSVTAVLATACGSGSGGGTTTNPSTGKTKITVGVIPIVDVAPIYLGIKQGFFAAKNLELTMQTAQGGAAIVPGVVSGQYQFGFSNVTSLLLASSQGLPLKVVASGNASTGVEGKDFGAVIVKAGSPIKTAKDLAGKRIAVNTLKNINTTTINDVVRKAGGDPSTIRYVELPFPNIAAAIAKGDVDAGQVVEPFLTIATQQGDRQVVSNYAGTDPNLEIGLYFTSKPYASQNPKVVSDFTAAMNQSLEYASAHPDDVRAVLTSYTQLDPTVQQNLVLPKFPTTIDKDAVQLLATLAMQDGLITKQPDLDSLLP